MFLKATTEVDKQVSKKGWGCQGNLLVELNKVENSHIKR